MKMLMVLGSPRKDGNGEVIARIMAEVLEKGGWTVDYVRLNSLKLRPCQGCGGCDKTGVCVVKDDMGPIYEKVDEADRVMMVSPVYFYSLSAQCKIFGDRMQARWARRYLLKERFRQNDQRKGYLLSTAATRGKKIFDCSILTARYIFDAMDLEYGGEFLVKGVDERKAVMQSPEEMERARQFAADILEGRV
ncbi:flavodoxin family protein [Desulforhopalus singaporensis]|uniref:Multimeric flavodoxin WrbA n=1 Tax=Desulforhopalus singaporensis TaxID=91360 RepID=A0A1H0RTQ3_9BACT|nr:flavodoxin family protein [Desulforhopalus singaporensis]SDP32941.1 Multimeric flavodoxin WrbA [Desulforhopalus singaporensis]